LDQLSLITYTNLHSYYHTNFEFYKFWLDSPQAVVLATALFGRLLGIDQMPGTPIALDKSPSAGDIDSIPGVAET